MGIWHLTWATDGRHPIVPGEEGRRAVVRALGRCAGAQTVLFCLADDHLHLVLDCSRQRAGRLAQGLLVSLRALSGQCVEPARVRPVDTRSHLRSLVPYLLTQVQRHGLDEHPALYSGSCFPDLIGARVVEGLDIPARVGQVLPRFRLRAAFESVGIPSLALRPASDDLVRATGAARIVAACSAALAAPPSLVGKAAIVTQTRRCAVQLGRDVALATEELAWALSITTRAVRRLREPGLPGPLLRAARMRLALEDAVYSV